MKTPKQTFAVLTAITGFALANLANAQSAPVTLHVGDPAPSLMGGKFLQGDPITEFRKGTVYFLDFWATWCGPCKRALPFVEAIPKESKYDGKVVVMGVDVWEALHGASYDLKKVAAFVQSHPDMRYPVVADGENGALSEAFLKASGSTGIPTFMIVDQEGKIAWMALGASAENLSSFQPTLDKILAGTFDSAAFRASFEQGQADQEAIYAAYKLLHDGKYQDSLAAFDKISPASESSIQIRNTGRLRALLHTDVDKGLDYANALVAQAKGDPAALAGIADACGVKDLPAKSFSYAIDLFEKSISMKADANTYIMLGRTYKNRGDTAKALGALQEAMAEAKAEPIAEDDRAEMIKYCGDQIKQLQKS